ncbi:MAG: restriction endonuclease subunit S [Pseudomonadota bacterium]|nr:restriction endonuclease subunit S [Pseudomonadota bacterium]
MSDNNLLVSLADIAYEPVAQAGPQGHDEFVYVDIGSIDRDSKAIVDAKTMPAAKAPSRAKQHLKTGDVLVSMTRPNLNAVAIVPESLDEAIGSTGFHVLRSKWVVPQFLFCLVQSQQFVDAMCDVVQGALYPAVRPADIGAFKFRLPARAEQIRIVEKLEELLSGLDAGVAELKAAQKKLAQYRQSLLKAAVEGALTAQWRKSQPAEPLESGAALLARILAERRSRWETRQLAKFKAQGKTPPKDWQAKYPEPVAPDTAGLHELPQGWVWASLDRLIDEGPQNGLYLPATRYGHGCPILRIDDFQIGWVRSRDDLNLVDADVETVATYALQAGDIVINRVNSMTHLGKSLVVGESLDGVVFESNMMRSRLSPAIDIEYVGLYLGSEVGRKRLTQDAKWAVNQASINQQDVKKTPIPVPPFFEQQKISSLVISLLAATDAQQIAITHSLKQSAAQRKNILQAAFSGQLVPQDPADEPASALLARIRAERAERDKSPKARKPRAAKEPA